jgi:hypothetical protein
VRKTRLRSCATAMDFWRRLVSPTGRVSQQRAMEMRVMISDTSDFVSDIAPSRKRTTAGAAGLLSLAATPTFAIMALLTAVQGGGMPDMICSAAPAGLPLTGMVPMYALMSAFHLAPWIKFVSSRRDCRREATPRVTMAWQTRCLFNETLRRPVGSPKCSRKEEKPRELLDRSRPETIESGRTTVWSATT